MQKAEKTMDKLTTQNPETAQAINPVDIARADPNYDSLRDVLDAALLQAQGGKGAERHAKGDPFESQRMQSISRLLGSERGMAYQACKKVAEGLDLPTHQARVKELLGAINYIAGIVIYLEADQKGD